MFDDSPVAVAGIVTFDGKYSHFNSREKSIQNYVSRMIERKLRQSRTYQWGKYSVHFETQPFGSVQCVVDIALGGELGLFSSAVAERDTTALNQAINNLQTYTRTVQFKNSA